MTSLRKTGQQFEGEKTKQILQSTQQFYSAKWTAFTVKKNNFFNPQTFQYHPFPPLLINKRKKKDSIYLHVLSKILLFDFWEERLANSGCTVHYSNRRNYFIISNKKTGLLDFRAHLWHSLCRLTSYSYFTYTVRLYIRLYK